MGSANKGNPHGPGKGNIGFFDSIGKAIVDAASNTGFAAQNNATGTPAAATPNSDKGTGGNSDRIPAGPRPEYTFAGANPLTTSGFPVGHPKYKAPPSAPTSSAPKAVPAPVKKKSILTGYGGLARPTLGGVSKTILGS